jgi:UDP-GlcNAc:undecaprenyl-phosphate GlcNAc-1-phosphate transferase
LIGCLQFYFKGRFENNGIFVLLATSLFVVVWIVAITNAINFTDGLDGLASCLSLISTIAFAIVFRAQGRSALALPTAVALGGALLGFLPYNISPARIFMGDSGSMFIGFMFGTLSIMSLSLQPDIVAFLIVPIYFMIVPISDMCVAVLRRLIAKRSIMTPDHLHFHHKLNERFKNQRIVVLILSLAQLLFAAFGLLIYFTNAYVIGWIGLGLLAFVLCFYTVYYERKEQKKGGKAAE